MVEHIYVIYRIDLYDKTISKDELFRGLGVTLTKAFKEKDDALIEAERLNKINGNEYVKYLVQLARMSQ